MSYGRAVAKHIPYIARDCNATGRWMSPPVTILTKIQIGGSRTFGTGLTAANPAAKSPQDYQLPFRPGVYKAWPRLSTIARHAPRRCTASDFPHTLYLYTKIVI
jgi:hypothetical protein